MRFFKKISSSLVLLSLLANFTALAAPRDHTPPPPSTTTTTTTIPVPAPQPPAGPTAPSQDQLNNAADLGKADGVNPGVHEAQDRAVVDGKEDGLNRGEEEGTRVCTKEEQDKAKDAGSLIGFAIGEKEGERNAKLEAERDGQGPGEYRGRMDGLRRADADSLAASAGPGRDLGISQANSSDAYSLGISIGTKNGDQDAHNDADNIDYPRSREAYRKQRINEAVKRNDSFNQKNPVTQAASLLAQLSLDAQDLVNKVSSLVYTDAQIGGNGDGKNLSEKSKLVPDYRYLKVIRKFSTPEEAKAYLDAFTKAYEDSFATQYPKIFQAASASLFQNARDAACEKARHGNYQSFYTAGIEEGRSKGYLSTHDKVYQVALNEVITRVAAKVSYDVYWSNYQAYYDKHLEEARSQAYTDRYREIHEAAKKSAHDQKYKEVYAGYAQEAILQGQSDEAADFEARPARLLDAKITETIVNGVYEPGEALRVQFLVRNFSDTILAGQDLKVQVEALDPSAASAGISEEILAQDLQEKSITTVSEALELHVNENSANRTVSFRVSLSYQGKNVGEKIVSIVPKFMIATSFAENPVLKQGLPTTLKFRLHNQSKQATDANFSVNLSSQPDALEILSGPVTVGILNPGEDRVVEFQVIDRAPGRSSVTIPLVLQAKLGSGRLIGLIDGEQSIPLINDYSVVVREDRASQLRNAGITRVEYSIKNANSRLLRKYLQLKISFLGSNAESFVVIGPNPQYLNPLLQNQNLSFVIPVLIKSQNTGGTMQLELQEDGRTVNISQTDF